MTQAINVFWFRRDLRLDDNAGLYHALKSGLPVLPIFIFDSNILDKLQDRDDARVTFIHKSLVGIDAQLKELGSSLYVAIGAPEKVWMDLLQKFNVKNIFTNTDYEPYARDRDNTLKSIFERKTVGFHLFKDQVIFDTDEVVKDDGKPYTVFTPYKRKWLGKLTNFYLNSYPTEKYFANFYTDLSSELPSLKDIGFKESAQNFPPKEFKSVIENYYNTRDIPSIKGTSRISVHLRFGTVSIRKLAKEAAKSLEKTWLSELIWRDFYAMILWHFPKIVNHAFKPEYDQIKWRNNEEEFKAWCEGKTGYPIVDAGMRELNATGFMHNRVRMITASFLCKHLLIDWRWGEAYFARKLIDYDQASNVGGWQWAASSGNDAVPYFRIFNPELQTQKFDTKFEYIKKWIAEINDPFKYPQPIVDHKLARERVLSAYKKALTQK